jgi:PWWP domain
MSSDSSSYETAPLAPEPNAGIADDPATGGETMVQEESSNLVPNINVDPIPDSNPSPNLNADPVPSSKPDLNSDLSKKGGRKKKEVPIEAPPNYLFKFQDEEKLVELEGPEQAETELFKYKYKVNDLVWGKMKSYLWWPGQIYDLSLASEDALRIKKENHFLIAYFGDKAFAWIEASALKPYMKTFPDMYKQTSTEAFVRAVDSSLTEVSRRIEAALICNCSDKKSINEPLVDNAGIIDGTRLSDVDSSIILGSFKVKRIMEYVQEVAVYGSENTNQLEVVMGEAYLKAFDKFRGFPNAPVFGYDEEFGNDLDKVSELEKSLTGRKRKTKDEHNKDDSKQESDATPKKRGRLKKKKQVVVDVDDLDYDPQFDSDEKPKRGGSSKKGKQVKMSSDEYGLPSESDNVPKKRGRPKKTKRDLQ